MSRRLLFSEGRKKKRLIPRTQLFSLAKMTFAPKINPLYWLSHRVNSDTPLTLEEEIRSHGRGSVLPAQQRPLPSQRRFCYSNVVPSPGSSPEQRGRPLPKGVPHPAGGAGLREIPPGCGETPPGSGRSLRAAWTITGQRHPRLQPRNAAREH